MSIVTGNKLGNQIAEIFRLPKHIMSIRLSCEPNEVAKLIVEFAVTEMQSDEVLSIMKGYKLHDTDDGNG